MLCSALLHHISPTCVHAIPLNHIITDTLHFKHPNLWSPLLFHLPALLPSPDIQVYSHSVTPIIPDLYRPSLGSPIQTLPPSHSLLPSSCSPFIILITLYLSLVYLTSLALSQSSLNPTFCWFCTLHWRCWINTENIWAWWLVSFSVYKHKPQVGSWH